MFIYGQYLDQKPDNQRFRTELRTSFSDAFALLIKNTNRSRLSKGTELKTAMLGVCMTFPRDELPNIIDKMITQLLTEGIYVPVEVDNYSLPFRDDVFRINFEMLRPDYLTVVEKRTKIAIGGIRQHVEGFKDDNVFPMAAGVKFSWNDLVTDLEHSFADDIKTLSRSARNLNDFEDFRNRLHRVIDRNIFLDLRTVRNLFTKLNSQVYSILKIVLDFGLRTSASLIPKPTNKIYFELRVQCVIYITIQGKLLEI